MSRPKNKEERIYVPRGSHSFCANNREGTTLEGHPKIYAEKTDKLAEKPILLSSEENRTHQKTQKKRPQVAQKISAKNLSRYESEVRNLGTKIVYSE